MQRTLASGLIVRGVALGAVWLGCGCGGAPAPASSPAAEASQASAPAGANKPASATSGSSSGSSDAATAAAPAVPVRNSIHTMNHCSHPVGLKVERSGSSLETSLGSSTGTDQRVDNGDRISLLDAGKKVIDTITVAPEMTEIEISSDCQKLSSH